MIEELVQQGLTNKEAEIYITLTRNGASRAASVAKDVRINRTLVYALLDNLTQKGFVERMTINDKAFYVANDPEIFLQKARTQVEHANFLIRNLQNIKLTNNQPVIRTYQGIQGMQQMNETIIAEASQAEGDLLQIGQQESFVKDYPQLVEEFIQRRVENQIPLKVLSCEFEGQDFFVTAGRNERDMREIKFIQQSELDVDATTYIFGECIACIALEENLQGYIMRNKNMADLYRKMFYMLWYRV